jgi:5-methylcytosine-specific restriction protein A
VNAVPFIPDQLYHRRNDIHAKYGGNWQGGICPSANYPYIFIFTGKSGGQHGYADGWDNDKIFSYTGEGQRGDMEFTRGNLALRESLSAGKRVFLFEAHSKGYVKFVSEVEYFDCDYFETKDTEGKMRVGIKFFFKRLGAYLPIQSKEFAELPKAASPVGYYDIAIPDKTERSGLVTSRVGQGAYRKRVIHRWEYQCAVTGFNKLDILIASHIVPWSKTTDQERIDVHNGLLLSPNYDALFDRHFISFDEKGKIILSDRIESDAFHKIGVTGSESIKNLSEYNLTYLNRHRAHFLEQIAVQ